MELKWSEVIEFNQLGIDRVNEVSGIYRIGYYKPDNSRAVCYVGQADNLRKRLFEHLSPNEQNSGLRNRIKNHRCYFKCAGVSRQSDRDACELALYNKFGKTSLCNEISPPGDAPANINFD